MRSCQLIETRSVRPGGRLAEAGGGTARGAPGQQAVIDQATGWLAGRLDCSMSEAGRHLARLARETESSVAEAAALLLGDGAASAARARDVSAASVPPQIVPPKATPPAPVPPAPVTSVFAASMVDLLPVPAMLLSPVTGEAGEITDFVIERRNDNATSAMHDRHESGLIVGERVLRLFPQFRESGLFGTLTQTYLTGELLRLDLFPFRRDADGEAWTVDIRGQRAGDWLLVSWRGHDATSDRARRLEVTQRLGGLGWAEWNLITNSVTWSHGLYAMHGRRLSDGPMTLPEYLGAIHPEDTPVVEDMFRSLTAREGTTRAEYRVITGDGTRYLRLAATAVYDPGGVPLILRAVIQDVTASRAAELELDAARSKIERERREATLRMQQAALPTRRREFRHGRYDIAVRYEPAQSGNRVGGDWYEARLGRNGDVIVAIGDVAGHELGAAAGMARIGNALRGLTATGEPAHRILGWLNDLVCADEAPEEVASVALGSLGADHPGLRWAQAGHPPPVLLRDGEPRLLRRPSGLLLGTTPSAEYELATEDLAAGDVLIFYTDGLIERRDRDIGEGLIALLRAAADCRHGTATEMVTGLAARLDAGAEDDICVLAVRVTLGPLAG